MLKKDLKDIVFGYGPLQDLLRAPTISEVMVVRSDQIFVERDGIIEKSGRRFISDKVTESIVERIVAQVGRRIDKSQPLVDARLPDGSRVNAIIPPLAVFGPCLTIRKFPIQRLKMDDLIDFNTISKSAATFLRASVIDHRSILISGGTGSGKTTMLNVLSSFIPYKEPKSVLVPDVTGNRQKMTAPGEVEFKIAGHTYRLEPTLDEGNLFFIFHDKTAGRGTYGAGRFLDTPPPKDGKVVLDFNKAYNPPCAFTPFATCPLPLKRNFLPIEIPAGELAPEGH